MKIILKNRRIIRLSKESAKLIADTIMDTEPDKAAYIRLTKGKEKELLAIIDLRDVSVII